jgi:hypothetical protein
VHPVHTLEIVVATDGQTEFLGKDVMGHQLHPLSAGIIQTIVNKASSGLDATIVV